nr:UBN2 domain-containing protein [Tanacetum cinerariifolium]
MNASVQKFNQLVSKMLAHSRENDEDWMTRVEILYETHVGGDFKHKSSWLFLKGEHKWTNPESTNAKRSCFRVIDEEPEHFGDDALPRPPGLQRIAKKVVPFEEQSDDLKKKHAKNNEAKMVLYNALPKKEYERIFMCKTAKDIWQSLLITHQGNSQVKDNKIDLLDQLYEQFTIFEEESIDSGFARFNTLITSLKDLDEGFSSKNYVRKFLRALHPK